MIKVPAEISAGFDALLTQGAIPEHAHSNYRKWLRYYLDFSNKYHFDATERKTIRHFIGKLREKRQSAQQQKQAYHAISVYYEIVKPKSGVAKAADRKPIAPAAAPEDAQPGLKLTNASWASAFTGLSNEIKLRHYSPKTLKAYTFWAKKFQAHTRSKDPRLLSSEDAKEFLTYLAVERKVSASSQNQAFNALLFFYRHVLKNEFGELKGVVRAKRKPYIPVVLSRDEIDAIVGRLRHPHDLVAKLLYGCGLRLFECLGLRIQNFNFDTGVLTVHDGKGKKDRTVPLPDTIVPELKQQRQAVTELHQQDLAADYDGVFLYGQLERKYKNAAKELVWQWFFPAKTLTLVPETKERKRYHLHESHFQKAIKKAVGRARIPKRASAHTLRHSFCQPSAAGQLRYPHHPGIAGTQRCSNHHDLHPYRQKPHPQRGQKPP